MANVFLKEGMCNICAIHKKHYCSNYMHFIFITMVFINCYGKYFIVIVQNYTIALDSKKQILVIDDELDICLVLKIVLEKAGFLVKDYYNPILALDEFKSNFYDLIILDIQMPEINGLQLYREIRKRDKKAKICFLTASETIFDTAHKFFGVYTFIKKPIENSDLIRIVNELLNK